MPKVTTLRIHSGLDEWTESNARQIPELGRFVLDEPTNEELGIVPYSGRVVLLGYALYIALVIGFLVWLL